MADDTKSVVVLSSGDEAEADGADPPSVPTDSKPGSEAHCGIPSTEQALIKCRPSSELFPTPIKNRSTSSVRRAEGKHPMKKDPQLHISIAKVYSLSGQSNGTEVKIVVPEKQPASRQSRAWLGSNMKRGSVCTVDPEVICLDDSPRRQDQPRDPLELCSLPKKIRKVKLSRSGPLENQSYIPPAKIGLTKRSAPVKNEIELFPLHQVPLGNVSIHPIVVIDEDDDHPVPENGQLVPESEKSEPKNEKLMLQIKELTTESGKSENVPDSGKVVPESEKKPEDNNLESENAVDVKPHVSLNPLEKVIDKCLDILPSDEFTCVSKKFEKRIKKLPPGLLENVRFAKFVQEREVKMTSDSQNIYIYIKELLDELKRVSCPNSKTDTKKRIIPEPLSDANEQESSVPKTFPVDEPVPSTSGFADITPEKSSPKAKEVSSAHLLKLTQAQKKLHKAITRLEEAECDLDADEDSNYIKLSRFKARFLKINRKIAECLKLNPTLERRQDKRFKCQGSRILEVNVKIEKWVNRAKKANREFFPDFADILKLIESVNQEKSLGLSKGQILDEAKESFTAVGQTLKAQRVHDDMEVLDSYLSEDHNSFITDEPEDLKRQLDQNLQVGKDNLNRVFEEFVKKEVDSGEKPEEVQDEDVDNESLNEATKSDQEDIEDELPSEIMAENSEIQAEPTMKSDLLPTEDQTPAKETGST